ncbi:MAG: CAP domain-containing protein [Sandaracinaceae bacterium]
MRIRRRRVGQVALGALAMVGLAACDGSGDGMMMVTPEECPAPEVYVCPVTPVTTIGTNLTLSGTTIGQGDSFGGASCNRSGGSRASDIAFEFLVPQTGSYTIDTMGSDFDTLLTVRQGCEGAVMACNDDMGMGSAQSMVQVELTACERVLIVVDSTSQFEDGNVVVHVTPSEICDDAIDNDGDGAIDCDDSECFSAECLGLGEWPPPWAAFEEEVLRLTNIERARGADCGPEGTFEPTGPLEMDDIVRIASRRHSTEMGEMAFFDHMSPDGRSPFDRMSAVGFTGAQPWGENIATGYPTPEQAMAGWMSSPGHCANIMNPSYHVMGVGYALVDPSPTTHYWTQNFAGSH